MGITQTKETKKETETIYEVDYSTLFNQLGLKIPKDSHVEFDVVYDIEDIGGNEWHEINHRLKIRVIEEV